jgi:ABC-type multidrug transport system ATPase subunit
MDSHVYPMRSSVAMNVLECDGVQLDFGFNRVLSDIYLKCQEGEIVGLLGRNGSGKSCLMKIIFGMVVPSSKSVRINGIPIMSGFMKSTISYLPQHSFTPRNLKLKEAFRVYGVKTSATINYFGELESYLDLRPSELSGGILRILEIMLVSGLPSRYLLLDEPFSGIMPAHIGKLKEFFRNLRQEKGIVITDHLYRHILEVTDRMYLLANGKTHPISHTDQLITHGYLSGL